MGTSKDTAVIILMQFLEGRVRSWSLYECFGFGYEPFLIKAETSLARYSLYGGCIAGWCPWVVSGYKCDMGMKTCL